MEMTKFRGLYRILLNTLIIAAFLIPGAAFAQKSKKKGAKAQADTIAADKDAQKVAREHYNNGKAFYEEEDYAAALTEFQAAYDTRPHPIVPAVVRPSS